MLLKAACLAAIERGEVTLVFRRWRRPTVKPGGTLRTRIGVLAIDAVDLVTERSIQAAHARAAGFDSKADLLAALPAPRDDDALYRVKVRLAGEDPRIALRAKRPDAAERAALTERLDRFDAASRRGPWTRVALRLIAAHPGRRAPDLAAEAGFETRWFKGNVRKLKELGLTESLEVGYRLSPRGRALWRAL